MTAQKAWLDNLPPVVRIVLENYPASRDLREIHKQMKGLLPELRRQALWTIENQGSFYAEHTKSAPHGLVINPASGLNPFSTYGKCPDIECRIKNAEEIARTVGLYADCAVTGDPFSDHVILSKRWSQDDTMKFLTNFMVFARLAPLYRAGVFRFANNFSFWCKSHLAEFESLVDSAADDLEEELVREVRIEKREHHIVMHTDGVLGTPFLYGIPQTARGKSEFAKGRHAKLGRKLFKSALRGEIHETLFNMRRSAHMGAVTFSNSRASLLAARKFETDQSMTGRRLETWEASRSADLPWIGRITPEQVITLREEAHRALPRFRERLGSSLSGASASDPAKIVAQLREEAEEVKAELEALDVSREGKFRSLSGTLAMSVSVYGFAGEFIPAGAALTGLLSLLGLLHAAEHKERQELLKLTSKPGYVLLRAKELAEHAEKSGKEMYLDEVGH